LEEWLAGTNPTNAASSLRLNLLPVSNGFMLDWPSVAGKTYLLERSTNLMTGFDSIVLSNIIATAPTNTATAPITLPGAQFYRVGVQQ
jgi:hypothetical protein